jgi:hypothetical protein
VASAGGIAVADIRGGVDLPRSVLDIPGAQPSPKALRQPGPAHRRVEAAM